MADASDIEARLRALVTAGNVTIPPYPAVAFRLRKTVEEGNYGVVDLARIAAADEALAATVLRLANSGYFRGSAPVTTLREAIGRVGAQELCRVALAATIGQGAGRAGPLAELRRTAWRRSLASALCCQALAQGRGIEPHDAFLSGLLHDFGRVVAIACLEALDVIDAVAPMSEAGWNAVIDGVAADLGTMVAARWGLPAFLLAVIVHARRPEGAGEHAALVDLVAAADQVVALSEGCPYLLERDLEGVPGLEGPAEAQTLMRFLPAIAVYIGGLDDVAPATAAVPSRVAKPASLLGEPRHALDLPAAWVRSNGETPYRARAATPKGLALHGRQSMFEGTVVRVRLDLDAGPLDLSGRVARCTPAQVGYDVEVALFALPGPAAGAWDRFLGGLTPSPAGA